MKSKIILWLLFAALAHAQPTFVGFLSTREEGAVYAVKPSAEKPAHWVKLGDNVDGYAVAEYRTKEEVLVLKKDGQELWLKLKAAQVRDGTSSVAGAASNNASQKLQELDAARKKLADAQDRLTKLRAEREKMLAERRAKDAK